MKDSTFEISFNLIKHKIDDLYYLSGSVVYWSFYDFPVKAWNWQSWRWKILSDKKRRTTTRLLHTISDYILFYPLITISHQCEVITIICVNTINVTLITSVILNLLPGLKGGHFAITFHVVVVEEHETSINQKKCHGIFKGKTCFYITLSTNINLYKQIY